MEEAQVRRTQIEGIRTKFHTRFVGDLNPSFKSASEYVFKLRINRALIES
jgi:hypothetical protein